MKGFEKELKAGGSKNLFRFGGDIAGENADEWKYKGRAEKYIEVESPRSGRIRFPISRIVSGLDNGYFEFDNFDFAEQIVLKARAENKRE